MEFLGFSPSEVSIRAQPVPDLAPNAESKQNKRDPGTVPGKGPRHGATPQDRPLPSNTVPDSGLLLIPPLAVAGTMDRRTPEESSRKEDPDSGVDNTSESGHSGDEELQATDGEEQLYSDSETSSSKKESKVEFQNEPPLRGNGGNVTIELNNNRKWITEEYRETIEFYRALAESQCETVDFSVGMGAKKPDWFDEEKFKRGQKFARDHLFCINFAEMLSLFILFAQKSSLGPLIFTGKSSTPFTAFKRYLSTLSKLMSWYEDDIWSEVENTATRNLILVRGMHKSVYHQMTNSSSKDLAQKTTLGDPTTTALWCPLRNLIVEDFKESLPVPFAEVEQFSSSRKVWVNQADMSMTQFGFVGLAVTYPEYFGIYLASEEDLDAFLHLWRALGYLLGIKDEYNYCNSDLESVRRRTRFFLEVVAKPAFREVTCDWEHMCRCLTAGISYYLPLVNFESALLYLCLILEIDTPRLMKQITWKGYFVFQLHRFTFYLMRYGGVLKWLNSKLYEVIRRVRNAPPDVLERWENRKFSYTEQPGKCPMGVRL